MEDPLNTYDYSLATTSIEFAKFKMASQSLVDEKPQGAAEDEEMNGPSGDSQASSLMATSHVDGTVKVFKY